MMKKFICLFMLITLLPACSIISGNEVIYGNHEKMISLQNLKTRTIVHCYDSAEQTAFECAKFFENQGYVKFRNIPYKTADFDELKTDNYPSRRWRDGEVTPRW